MPQSSPDPEVAGSGSAGRTAQFVGFEVNGQDFAFAIGKIQEIIVLSEVTPIPQVEDYIEGVTNLRGDIIPIVDLRQLFGMPAIASTRESRVIVVNVGEKTVGCRVDAVSQVLSVPDEAIQPAPDLMAGDVSHYIEGFANLEDQIVVLLNSDELLDPTKLESVSASAASSLVAASASQED